MGNAGKTEILDKLKSGYALPSLSPIAVRLVELAVDDTSSMEELADLVGKDPSLTIRVLKLANSPFFKAAYPVATIKQAVMRMGFHHLRIVALSLSLKDTFPLGRVGNMNYAQFWRVSLYRGLLAQSFARMLRLCEPDEAFITGLTLEVGFLVYFEIFLKDGGDDIDPGMYPLESLLSMEKEKHGLDHRDVGEIALRYWKFPESIVGCQQYTGLGAGAGEPSGLSKVCRMAGKLSALICYSRTDFNEVFHTIASSSGLSNETLYEVVITTLSEVDEIAEALRVTVEHEKDMFGLLEKANKTLSRLSEQILKQSDAEKTRDLPSFDSLRGRSGDSEGPNYVLQAMAHEIRNPLTVVGGFARRLAKTTDPSSDGWKYIEAILEETKRLERALEQASRGLRD